MKENEMERNTVKLTNLALLAWIVIVLLVNICVVYAETTYDRMDWFRDASNIKLFIF